MTYTIKVWYAAHFRDDPTGGDSPQVHTGIGANEAFDNGFLRDLITLEGEGVRRVSIEAEVAT